MTNLKTLQRLSNCEKSKFIKKQNWVKFNWIANGKIDVGFSTFKYFGEEDIYSFPMMTYL